MPKVTILEKDLTSSGQQSNDNFVVLVPGVYNEDLWAEDVDIEPILISNVATAGKSVTFEGFEEIIFGNMPRKTDPDYAAAKAKKDLIEASYGFKVTKKLFDLGMTVLYGIISWNASMDIDTVVQDALEGDSTSNFFDLYADRSLYDIRFITTASIVDSTTAIQNAIACAAERGDAIALVDLPLTASYTDVQGTTHSLDLTKAEDIQKYLDKCLIVEPVERKFVSGGTEEEDPFTYAAAFAPKYKYFIGNVYDKTKGYFVSQFETELGSFAYLSAFANHINRFPEWYAMAGSIRGVLPQQQVTPTIKFGMNDINAYLTIRDGRWRACNPICEVRPYGNILFGNRTLYKIATEDVEKYGIGLRASHFLNIRQLCCTLKKVLYRASRRFMFEPNTDILWVNFCEAIRPTLEFMKTNQGIRGYSIERENTAVKGVLKAKITIVPIEALEDFDLTVELADSVEISE